MEKSGAGRDVTRSFFRVSDLQNPLRNRGLALYLLQKLPVDLRFFVDVFSGSSTHVMPVSAVKLFSGSIPGNHSSALVREHHGVRQFVTDLSQPIDGLARFIK